MFHNIKNRQAMKSFIPLLRLILIGILGVGAGSAIAASARTDMERATFAGGCFWCMASSFDPLPGVVEVIVGYTGGQTVNPSYDNVTAGKTDQVEAVQVLFDPTKISYTKLLNTFWHNIDPTVTNRQFCDVGSQYRAEIFYHDPEQQRHAEQSRFKLAMSRPFKETIVTKITAATAFYPAEEYHQHYYRKKPLRYKYYHYTCGRAQRLKELWGNAPAR